MGEGEGEGEVGDTALIIQASQQKPTDHELMHSHKSKRGEKREVINLSILSSCFHIRLITFMARQDMARKVFLFPPVYKAHAVQKH